MIVMMAQSCPVMYSYRMMSHTLSIGNSLQPADVLWTYDWRKWWKLRPIVNGDCYFGTSLQFCDDCWCFSLCIQVWRRQIFTITMRTIITGLRLALVRSVVQLFSIRTAGISTDITSASFTVSNVRSCVLMYRALSHSHIQYYETWLSSGFSEKSHTIDMSIGFHKAGHVKWLLWLGGLLRQLLSCREKFLKFSVKNLNKNFRINWKK